MVRQAGRRVRGAFRNMNRMAYLLVIPTFRDWGRSVLRERRNHVVEKQRVAWMRSDRMIGDHPIRSVVGIASKDAHAGRVLAALVRSTAAQRVIELGTNVGISGTYLASALPEGGRLLTVDQSADRQAVARELFDRAGVADRIEVVTGSFSEVLESVAEGGFDVAFVDGDHTFSATIWLVETLIEHAHPGSLIVVDDIKHSSEMRRAWRSLGAHHRVEAISLSDFGALKVVS